MSNDEASAGADRDAKAIMDEFVVAFENDDKEILFRLLDPNCDWVLMATGERFKGMAEIGKMVETVAAAREHTKEANMTITRKLASTDGFCIEMENRGVVAKGFPGIENPEKDQPFEMNFCVTAYIRNGLITEVHEYYDLAQFTTPPDKRRKIFS